MPIMERSPSTDKELKSHETEGANEVMQSVYASTVVDGLTISIGASLVYLELLLLVNFLQFRMQLNLALSADSAVLSPDEKLAPTTSFSNTTVNSAFEISERKEEDLAPTVTGAAAAPATNTE